MSISRVKDPPWGHGEKVTSDQLNALDAALTNALDKRDGQTDTLESVVSCAGAGRIVQSRKVGANADTTYAVADGISIIDASSGLTNARAYTLSTTGAVAGDRVIVIGGAQNVTVKDGSSSSTLAIVGTSATAYAPSVEFVFNGTAWTCPLPYAAGVGAFLKSPTSANLAAAVTDETGTGALMFNNSPTVAGTPTLSGTGTTTSNNAKGTCQDTNPVNVQTTDATETTLDSFVVPSNAVVVASWVVSAIKSDASEGFGAVVGVTYRNQGGSLSAVGSPQIQVMESGSWDVGVSTSGTTVRLRVTGAAGTTIQWAAVCTRLTVIP